MHHKKHKPTTRSWSRRADMKSYRQQEARALDDIDRTRPQPRTDRWGYRPELLPLGDAACTGAVRGKKKARPKKDRCRVNKTHQWYKEWIVREDYYVRAGHGYWDCQECNRLKNLHGWYNRMYCVKHTKRVPYTERVYLATCIHCWQEKRLRAVRDPSEWRASRRSHLALKKRKLDLVAGMTVRS